MAANQFVGVAGVARKVKGQYVGVNGVARKVKNGFVGVNGVARRGYAGAEPVTVRGNNVKPDDSGDVYYGQTVPEWSQVTGWVQFHGAKYVVASGSHRGTVELSDSAHSFTIAGNSCTIHGSSAFSMGDFDDPTNQELTIYLGQDCLWMSFSALLQTGEDYKFVNMTAEDATGVSFELTFTP